jgi:peptidoglycan/xylan/chitin deacetylase (PgdA/CDA1 family)
MKVILTIDVEAHRVIDEISGEREDSLQTILDLLKKYGFHATFFVDMCETKKWGRDFIGSVCRRILRCGHDVQLHAHPHHYTGDGAKWHLSQYDSETQRRVLRDAILEFETAVGRPPSAFRAGGFGCNADTLAILREEGLRLDSSVMFKWPGSNVEHSPPGAPADIGGILELPMTPVITLGTRAHPLRTGPLDFNWIPVPVIKRALRSLMNEQAGAAVILFHSSSMLRRTGMTTFSFRKSNVRRFERLLRALSKERYEVATVANLLAEDVIAQGFWQDVSPQEAVYVENNLLWQYLLLLFQSAVGGRFKPKFAMFIALNGVFFLLLLIGLVAMIVRMKIL